MNNFGVDGKTMIDYETGFVHLNKFGNNFIIVGDSWTQSYLKLKRIYRSKGKGRGKRIKCVIK